MGTIFILGGKSLIQQYNIVNKSLKLTQLAISFHISSSFTELETMHMDFLL